jgi:hypothetical protein
MAIEIYSSSPTKDDLIEWFHEFVAEGRNKLADRAFKEATEISHREDQSRLSSLRRELSSY